MPLEESYTRPVVEMERPPAKVDVDMLVTERFDNVVVPAERNPENVEVEFVPATFKKPWIVEVPVVFPCRVVVAAVPEVLPTQKEPKTERLVEEAPAVKFCKAVHVLATERDAPLPPPTQVPKIEKHPPAILTPRAKVEVAEVPVTLR